MGDTVSIENPESKKSGFILNEIVKRKILNTYKISKNNFLQTNKELKELKSVKTDSSNN